MPEVIFTGSAGRLEGRYHHARAEGAPIALVLHPHPQMGGTMNNRIVYTLFKSFVRKGFTTLRFNFRGVGKSQGKFDRGEGEFSDAAAALDWLQSVNPHPREIWIGGFSFGAWVGMQLLMRRPEINRFIIVAPPAAQHDFGFLAPCPSSGLIMQGSRDEVVPQEAVAKLVAKLRAQRGISVDYAVVPGANHFFNDHIEALGATASSYIGRVFD